ncbi:MAG TPA: M20/M25/M40 family metallo-hydrolase [Longimicrobiales bacterium]|nr:M20/M25/M40 family metallo-hydrolase [Longimicrobiales bacterium]
MRFVRIFVPVTLLSLASGAAAQGANSGAAATNGSTRTTPTITAADVRTHIAYLASDELKGRNTPSPGLELAAEYIANEFKMLGLRPAGDSGTYVQRFPYEHRELRASGARAELRAGSWSKPLTYVADFFVLPSRRDSVSGSILYVGTAKDEQGATPINAAGKILTYYVPGAEANNEWAVRVRGALMSAMGASPGALVLVLDSAFTQSAIAFVAANAAGQALPFPVAGVRYHQAQEWLKQAGLDLAALRNSPPATPVANSATVTLTTKVEGSTSRPPNVVAMLPGSDPVLKDTYIVFSAHMDHVGVGQPNAKGDSIYNGADDDASGTSAVLEVAQAFAALPQAPKRSVIFLLVSGEEKGLLGSQYFAANPPVPTDQIVANINIDMIGRNHPDTVVAIGQEYTTLGATVQQVAKQHADLKLVVAPDLWPQEQLFFRSDHFSFAQKNIPAIFFTTGLHDDYHQPSDEVQTIDTDKTSRIANLVFRLGAAVADNADAPKWTEEGRKAMKAVGVMR